MVKGCRWSGQSSAEQSRGRARLQTTLPAVAAGARAWHVSALPPEGRGPE